VYRNAHAWTATKLDGTIACWGLDTFGVSSCPTAPWKPVAYVFSTSGRFCYRKCTPLSSPCTLSCHFVPDYGRIAATVQPESTCHLPHAHPSPRVTPPPVYPCALPVYEDTTINWISCTVMVGLLASALLLQRLVRTTAYNHPSTVRRASRAITLPPPSGVLPCRRYSALGLSPSLACSQPLLSSSCISLHSYTSLLSCISLVCATPAPELAETRACILANAFTAEESVPGSSSALLLSISC
jgi:hypothetical protein